MKTYICVICGKECEGFGNNPMPLRKEGSCCDSCDIRVTEERLRRYDIISKAVGEEDE